ncbi:hypothetical protein Ddye_005915 [Dipteronia dyeriana]|uniref:Uncharacterized protein n=1 Tax=Dipteronia dyeriana TaxID=168575 RepID=A0AAE0CQ52_9ROSI|nr:hypothetical protein Ddye_005915 [Dipteronia dyeriana]
MSQRKVASINKLNLLTKRDNGKCRPFLPVMKISPTELKESPRHHCKKIFVIEACLEEVDEDVIKELEEDAEVASEEEVPKISLHAISGTRSPETKRIRGIIDNINTTILVDFGSTHNFVIESSARKVELQPVTGGRFEVVVASGDRLSSSGWFCL